MHAALIRLGLFLALFTALLHGSDVAQAQERRIPLQEGLVLVYSGFAPGIPLEQTAGEMERVVLVSRATPEEIVFDIQFTDYAGDPKLRNQKLLRRLVRRQDMEGAHRLLFRFLEEDPPNLPGLTILHASRAMLKDFSDSKASSIVFANGPLGNAGWFSAVSRKYYRGTLDVVDANAPVEVLVNGEKVVIATVHVHGVLTVADLGVDADFWFSRDADNPVLVRFQQKEGNWIQLVHADFPVAPPPKPAEPAPTPQSIPPASPPPVVSAVAEGLSSAKCRASMQGVYFDTGSATLLPPSTPALQQVASLLIQHRDWAVTIEGHTDNVGAAAYNLDLSNRRAASVREALTGQYGAPAGPLSVQGFGESRPIDSNDTPVGRAHNRRVELARKCG